MDKKRLPNMLKLLLSTLFFFSVSLAYADVRPIGLKDGNLALLVTGQINPQDSRTFQELLQLARSTNQRIKFVYLDSPGGDVKAGYQIALLVRDVAMSSFVPNFATCASSCFMIFMAGSDRYHGESVRVGVHSASDMQSRETERAMSATVQMSRFLRDLGTPPSVLGRLVTARPSEMAWLTPTELQDVAKIVLSTPVPVSMPVQQKEQVAPRTEVSRSEKQQARDLNAEAIQILRVNRFNEAIPVLKRAAQLAPFDAEIQGNLGFAYFLARDYKNARDTLALALGLKKNRGSTWVNLGQTVSELGDLDWAVLCFQKYLEFSSNKAAAIAQLQFFRDQQSGVISRAAARALQSF